MTPHQLAATDAATKLRRGEVAAADLIESCLGRVEAINPAVNAMVTICDDRARREAEDADERRARGETLRPLHGLPIAIKDLQPTAGVRTTFGSPAFADNIPTDDCLIVRRIRDAGGIVIGKTNIPEFSIGANTVNPLFGATGNPFDVDLTCGGSSGGSAVAVATEMAPLATGSDHGGSLRIPAAFSGVVGYRATPGVVPNDLRSVPQTFYSVQGPIARTVDDVALLMSVIAGRDSADPMSFPLDATSLAELDPVDPSTLRIAASEDLGGLIVSKSIRTTFRDRVQRFAGAVGDVATPTVDLRRAGHVDWMVRSDLFVAQYGNTEAANGSNPNIAQSLTSAMATPMADIAEARREQLALCRTFAALFDDHDVVVCPCVGVSPFPWTQTNPAEVDGQPIATYMDWLGLTAALTVVGHPVVTIPCGLDEHGMAFGVQLVGPMYEDRRLLSIAASLEQVFAADPVTQRPIPDADALRAARSLCREAAVSTGPRGT